MTTRDARRRTVWERAGGRCEYCQADERICGQRFETDHIIPLSAGGADDPSNLALACRACNGFKGATFEVLDASKGTRTAVFHPRRDAWTDHFEWDASGAIVVARSEVGRVSITTLRLNDALRVAARLIWVAAGWHPPPRT